MLQLSHNNLDVWKFSLELIDKIFSLTNSFTKEELFGLTNQLRRASISAASNLSENDTKEIESFMYSIFAMITSLINKIKNKI